MNKKINLIILGLLLSNVVFLNPTYVSMNTIEQTIFVNFDENDIRHQQIIDLLRSHTDYSVVFNSNSQANLTLRNFEYDPRFTDQFYKYVFNNLNYPSIVDFTDVDSFIDEFDSYFSLLNSIQIKPILFDPISIFSFNSNLQFSTSTILENNFIPSNNYFHYLNYTQSNNNDPLQSEFSFFTKLGIASLGYTFYSNYYYYAMNNYTITEVNNQTKISIDIREDLAFENGEPIGPLNFLFSLDLINLNTTDSALDFLTEHVDSYYYEDNNTFSIIYSEFSLIDLIDLLSLPPTPLSLNNTVSYLINGEITTRPVLGNVLNPFDSLEFNTYENGGYGSGYYIFENISNSSFGLRDNPYISTGSFVMLPIFQDLYNQSIVLNHIGELNFIEIDSNSNYIYGSNDIIISNQTLSYFGSNYNSFPINFGEYIFVEYNIADIYNVVESLIHQYPFTIGFDIMNVVNFPGTTYIINQNNIDYPIIDNPNDTINIATTLTYLSEIEKYNGFNLFNFLMMTVMIFQIIYIIYRLKR